MHGMNNLRYGLVYIDQYKTMFPYVFDTADEAETRKEEILDEASFKGQSDHIKVVEMRIVE